MLQLLCETALRGRRLEVIFVLGKIFGHRRQLAANVIPGIEHDFQFRIGRFHGCSFLHRVLGMRGKCECQQDRSEKRYSFHFFLHDRVSRIKASAPYFAGVSPATTAASLSSIWLQPSNWPLFFALSMGSFPMKVSFVWPFPRSSKRVTSYAPSLASCSIPNCSGSILFPSESEK